MSKVNLDYKELYEQACRAIEELRAENAELRASKSKTVRVFPLFCLFILRCRLLQSKPPKHRVYCIWDADNNLKYAKRALIAKSVGGWRSRDDRAASRQEKNRRRAARASAPQRSRSRSHDVGSAAAVASARRCSGQKSACSWHVALPPPRSAKRARHGGQCAGEKRRTYPPPRPKTKKR